MFMVASSVVLTVVVLNYHHRRAEMHDMPGWIQELMKKTTEEFQLSEPRYPFELLIMLLLLVVATTYLSYQTVWLRGRMRAHEQLDVQDDHFLPHLEQVAEV
ncbi:hypothetical protein OUZ56_010986 [Daphnia magna]|uniref:Neurotransmitter-gated ion-channel transmembrane domain-containing protein n=1 Tax=Daphnia magna TaxID=35525 RepID=A0ABQ9YYZ1_9CRUS|nr:hypothetical protein OUZ56_010986 [Daphnia magna]